MSQRKRRRPMIKQYIKQRRSWLALLFSIHAFVLFVAFIDPLIPFTSVLYIAFLSFIGTTVFVVVRYYKETSFYKRLDQWEEPYDMNDLHLPERPFEHIVYTQMKQQTAQHKQDVSAYRMELEREKDEMLSWIHEVKTPLTTMQLMVERVDDRALHKQLMVEWLRIDLLLDQQLHQKRIPFIENDVYIEDVKLHDLLTKEIKHIQSWCIQRGIGVDLELQVQSVISDVKWLGFIIRQLLTNAVKYSEQTDIHIHSYKSGDQTIVDIIDEGRGIDSKDLPRIFDKGFTSTAQPREMAATGMGLYLTRKVAATLFVQIEVTSEPNVGTTFTLTFPDKNELADLTSM